MISVSALAGILLAPLCASAQLNEERASCDSGTMQTLVTKGYFAARHADWQKLIVIALTFNVSSGVCREPEQAITAALYGDFFGAIGFAHSNMRQKARELLKDGLEAAHTEINGGVMMDLSTKMLRRYDDLAAHPMDVPG